VALTAAALLVGVADNPPGVALLFCAGFTLVLAVVHRWRSSKKFGFLFLGAVLGFFIMVVVHNFAEVGADQVSHIPVLFFFLSAVSVIGFLAAIFICPVASLVGAIGWVAMLGREARKAA
jgi:hypothetical protein